MPTAREIYHKRGILCNAKIVKNLLILSERTLKKRLYNADFGIIKPFGAGTGKDGKYSFILNKISE